MVHHISLKHKIGYGIGDIGSNIFIVSTGMFLLFFLTNVLGVEPALAGLALLIPKLWDVISDPIMGAISDATHSRWGRRRPYLLYASLPFGLVFFLLFIAPHTQSQFTTALWVGSLFALSCTAFTVYNIPYSAMVAEMTDDYNERMSVTSFRMVGSTIGVLLAGGLAMPLVDLGGGGEAGFRAMGLIFGILISLFCVSAFWGTKGTRMIQAEKASLPVKEQLKIAFRNTPFKRLMSMYALQSLAIGILMAGQIYYVKYVMGMPEAQVGMVSAVLFITAIVFIPVWVKIGVRIGKIRAYKFGIAILVIMLFSLLFTQPQQTLLFFIQMFILGIGFSSFQLFPFSMLPDTIEFDELQSRLRREGVFSGVWASGQKTAYAVGPSLIGFTLSLTGFVLTGDQPDSVVWGIRVIFCVVTAGLFLLSLIPFKYYDLTESRFAEIKAEIKATAVEMTEKS
ncbi:MAG: MFS transporter [FCB group bacterium]|nr:MFS transporter [FCB group bacterium]MBL7027120.1 MFS transporter [Candidatus Neomarinimicrobiota bacterium]MBL7120645.1 MFS transporter [Candidatus Neomarinimicrobiota bacterium]